MDITLKAVIERATWVTKELENLRSLSLKSELWNSCTPEIKKTLVDQEYYLTEYSRNLNRQIYELTKYEEK